MRLRHFRGLQRIRRLRLGVRQGPGHLACRRFEGVRGHRVSFGVMLGVLFVARLIELYQLIPTYTELYRGYEGPQHLSY